MSSNIELGLTLTEKFVGCLPQYFESDEDGNLHHDIRKANVFAEGRLFADAYKGEVVVESAAEFATIKQRLLTLPTFVEVSLKKSDSSALSNTTYTTTGKFIVYLNPSNPVIKNQLREKLDHVEMLMNQGKNFALEICLDDALKFWYEMRFRDGRNSSYEANGANICVTNFSRRFHECYHPLLWVGCFPIMLICGTPYCIYRKAKCIDIESKIRATVVYIEGVSQQEHNALGRILAQAFLDGMNSAITRAPTNEPPPYQVTPPPNPNIALQKI